MKICYNKLQKLMIDNQMKRQDLMRAAEITSYAATKINKNEPVSLEVKLIVDDKSRYTDWSARDDIKANLQVDLILLLDEFGYPPVTIDDVYKEVLEQAENFKKYAQ